MHVDMLYMLHEQGKECIQNVYQELCLKVSHLRFHQQRNWGLGTSRWKGLGFGAQHPRGDLRHSWCLREAGSVWETSSLPVAQLKNLVILKMLKEGCRHSETARKLLQPWPLPTKGFCNLLFLRNCLGIHNDADGCLPSTWILLLIV